MGPRDDLRIWDRQTSEERERWALRVAERLPPTFTYQGLRRHELGDQSHELAFFGYEDATFALIPGGTVTLGYDPENPFVPNEHQTEEWEHTEKYFGGDFPMPDYLAQSLTHHRTVTLRPFLMETHTRDLGTLFNELYGDEDEDEEAVIATACAGGFRLPTPDEWEYVCSGGATTLFRWGNDTPPVVSAQAKNWDLHKRPNAFGLQMTESSYDCEVCAGVTLRGGDGGTACCGGIGKFATWLPFASSFACQEQTWYGETTFGMRLSEFLWRRVFSL